MMQSPKTLYVVCTDPRNPIGGAETSFLQILQISPQERDRCLIAASGEGAFSQACRDLGFEVVTVPMVQPVTVGKRNLATMARYLWDLRTARRLTQLIARNNVQLVCTLSRGAHPYGALAGRLMRRAVVLHIRDIPQSRFARTMYRILVDYFATRVVVFSRAVRDAIDTAAEKFEILPMGIDLDLYQPRPHSEFSEQWSGCFPILGTAGRISRDKGLCDLLHALALVVVERPRTKLAIAGQVWVEDLSYQSELEALIADLGLEDNVTFVGQLSQSQMPAFLSAVDIVVVASHFESFGRTVVEGMAVKKPVIATRCGGPQEIITEGTEGRLVDVSAVQELAEAILWLAQDDDLRARMGMQGRRKAEQYYDARQYAAAVLAFQQSIIGL